MPIYSFYNEKTGETKDIVMSVFDKHEFIDKDGYKWTRIWHKPNASVDAKLDPFSPKDFVKYTSTRAGKVGDLNELSAELSQKRADKLGAPDPLKKKFYDDYASKRRGKRHPKEKQEVLQQLENKVTKIIEKD